MCVLLKDETTWLLIFCFKNSIRIRVSLLVSFVVILYVFFCFISLLIGLVASVFLLFLFILF